MPCCLPPDTPPALAAIVAGPIAWSMTADLAALGIALAELLGLADAGLVDRWAELDAWTLTGYGAAMLRVAIVEHGAGCVPRWGNADREPPPLRLHPSQMCGVMSIDCLLAEDDSEDSDEMLLYEDPRTGAPMTMFGGYPVYTARRSGWHRRPMHCSMAS